MARTRWYPRSARKLWDWGPCVLEVSMPTGINIWLCSRKLYFSLLIFLFTFLQDLLTPFFSRSNGCQRDTGEPGHVRRLRAHAPPVRAGLGGHLPGDRGHLHAVPPPPHAHVGEGHPENREELFQLPYQHRCCARLPRPIRHCVNFSRCDACTVLLFFCVCVCVIFELLYKWLILRAAYCTCPSPRFILVRAKSTPVRV